MIIGATAMAIQRAGAERTSATAAGPAAPASAAPETDPAADALDQLGDFVEAAARARKAFAEERLKYLKEQMTTLSLFNLAPGFLVDHSARMARELEAAAKDFASAFRTLESRTGTADTALPAAYGDVLADDAGPARLITAEDAETAASFVATARHLRSVVDLAADGEEDKPFVRRAADGARDATAQVVDIMGRLEGPSLFGKMLW